MITIAEIIDDAVSKLKEQGVEPIAIKLSLPDYECLLEDVNEISNAGFTSITKYGDVSIFKILDSDKIKRSYIQCFAASINRYFYLDTIEELPDYDNI